MCNEQEQNEPKWGEARAQMRITIELYFVDGGVKANVKAGPDDVLPKNVATLILRSMICESLSKEVKKVVGQTCKAVRNIAHTVRDFDADVAKERIDALAELVGLKDEEEPKAE
jgi:hypothetical protein